MTTEPKKLLDSEETQACQAGSQMADKNIQFFLEKKRKILETALQLCKEGEKLTIKCLEKLGIPYSDITSTFGNLHKLKAECGAETDKKTKILETALQICKDGGIISDKALEMLGISRWDVSSTFVSLRELRTACGVETDYRKASMGADELKKHIKGLVTSIATDSGCWLTNKLASREDGRTVIKYQGQAMVLYRLVHQLFIGELIEGLCVRHKCDNEECFNPDHLVQGTFGDNNRDREERGRSKHGNQKFKPHGLVDPYDYHKLLEVVKARIIISELGEWLYQGGLSPNGYACLTINKKRYALHRLMLANKLKIKYEDIEIACHKFPENSLFKGKAPQRNDINPDHLYDGTFEQNATDSASYHKNFSLSEENVIFIREEAKKIKSGVLNFDKEMALMFNTSAKVIGRVRLGITYKFIGNVTIAAFKYVHEKPVVQFDLEGNLVRKYASAKEAASVLGQGLGSYVWPEGISTICRKRKGTYKGFKWFLESDLAKNLEDLTEELDLTKDLTEDLTNE